MEYINRPQIAKLMGIQGWRLCALVKTKDFTMPQHIAKQNKTLLYDKEKIMQWLTEWQEQNKKAQCPVKTEKKVVLARLILPNHRKTNGQQRDY
jgi:hypothetical protein